MRARKKDKTSAANRLLMTGSSSALARNFRPAQRHRLLAILSDRRLRWKLELAATDNDGHESIRTAGGRRRSEPEHSFVSPHGGIVDDGGSLIHSDDKRNPNEMESGPIPTHLSPSSTCQITDPLNWI